MKGCTGKSARRYELVQNEGSFFADWYIFDHRTDQHFATAMSLSHDPTAPSAVWEGFLAEVIARGRLSPEEARVVCEYALAAAKGGAKSTTV